MPATLGEFLSTAEGLFAAAETDDLPVTNYSELAIQAHRMVGVLGRYLDNVVPAGPGTDTWQQDAAGIRTELRAAEGYLERVLPPANHPLRAAEKPDDPATARYAQAVDALAAGNDLLATHKSLDSTGIATPRSDWTRFLTAEPIATALTSEIAGWASRAAQMTGRITHVPGPLLPEPDLAAARNRLESAARARRESQATGARRDLLHAIPAAIFPERITPPAHESDADLHAGIAASAHGLRMAAFTTAGRSGDSPVLSGPAWRRTAQASAIICDLAVQMLDVLAAHPAAAAMPPEQLRVAASAFITARDMWRQATKMWKFITTDTTHSVSRAGTDTTDLVIRLGRLMSGDPAWTPSSAGKISPRNPGTLTPGALAAALGAVHTAGDALTRMACADLSAIGAASQEGRLYIRAKDYLHERPERAYVPAPADRVHMLRNAMYLCADTTWQATSALEGPVLAAEAASRILTMIRPAPPGPDHVLAPEIGFILDPGRFTRETIHLFERPRRARGRYAKTLDPAELIHAYEDEHLSLTECAARFTTSLTTVRKILVEHGCRIRTEGEWQQFRNDRERPSPPSPPAPEPDENGTVYSQLRHRGVTDRALLDRAATIDHAVADVMNTARKLAPANNLGTEMGRRSPAALAAQDGPSNATAAVAHAATAQPSPKPEAAPTPASRRSRRP